MADTKSAASVVEMDSQRGEQQTSLKSLRAVESLTIGLSALALLCGLTMLGTAADTIAVYESTHLEDGFQLPLWPSAFDLSPTNALVAAGVIVALASAASLLGTKMQTIRNRSTVYTPLSILAPSAGFVAVMVAMIFFYAVNASDEVDTVQSWSCQWHQAAMTAKPHFGTLCRESKTALYLAVILVPVELVLFGLAGYRRLLLRRAISFAYDPKPGTPEAC